ncbi:MAG TPA: histidine kinase [Bacteroidia bacterium]|nr:histidine kinase [Bacteroidia bacterium]
MQPTPHPLRWLTIAALWLGLTGFFILVNSAYTKYQVAIQAVNATLFTIGYLFSYRYLVRTYLYNSAFLKFVPLYLLTIGVLSFASLVTVYKIYILEGNKFYVENYWKEPVFITSNYLLMLMTTTTLISFRVLKDKRDTQALLESAEKEKISTELNFLNAQINPHFLFNSLNNILFQIDKSNDTARETLLKFSEMLRYQLYDCSSDFIAIEKELRYLRNYVEIQMLRKSEKYNCRLHISDSVRNFQLAPLLLIPFIENAFKHISHHRNAENNITVDLDYKDEQFEFSVYNDSDNTIVQDFNESKGIGLTNVKRRLDLLYPDRYRLDILREEQKFSVHLKIKVSP